MGFLCFFNKEQNLFLFIKTTNSDLKNQEGWIKKKRFFSTLTIFQSFVVIFA